MVKMCDTGAYFTGSAIGRHKMIPWLSPGKTWEGLAGGLITSMLTGWGLAELSAAWLADEPVIPVGWALGFGLVIGVVGQLGDLLMRLLKRGGAIKDSSPGAGTAESWHSISAARRSGSAGCCGVDHASDDNV